MYLDPVSHPPFPQCRSPRRIACFSYLANKKAIRFFKSCKYQVLTQNCWIHCLFRFILTKKDSPKKIPPPCGGGGSLILPPPSRILYPPLSGSVLARDTDDTISLFSIIVAGTYSLPALRLKSYCMFFFNVKTNSSNKMSKPGKFKTEIKWVPVVLKHTDTVFRHAIILKIRISTILIFG